MPYDIFLSYPHTDTKAVAPLVDALRKLGVAVWFDEHEIGDAQAITASIIEGLGASRMLVAWYSQPYALSRPCQWELTAAFLAAQQEGDVGCRLLVINPEPGAAHIHPVKLRDRKFLEATADPAALARRIAGRLVHAASQIGDIRPLQAPPWHGGRRTGSNRFVGRVPDLWRVHSGLTSSDVAIITGKPAGSDLVQVQGMGGIGKSLLAEEYALRFGAAYPGGIIWLSAAQPNGTVAEKADAALDRQIYELALRFNLPVQGQEPPTVHAMVQTYLGSRPPYLWVVDDLPADATADTLRRWLAPSGNGRTLVTTRSTRLEGNGVIHPLGILAPEDAIQLLTVLRVPQDAAERTVAETILAELGNHALAVDVARAAVARLGYAPFLERLRYPGADALRLAGQMAKELPNGHQTSIAATLLQSIHRLDADGTLVLQLASLLAPEPIPSALVEAVFAHLTGDPSAGEERALLGASAAADEALVETAEGDAIMVHVLVSRTLRFHAPAPDALRKAAVDALNDIMLGVEDIRNHVTLRGVISHARVLSASPDDAASATLLTWLAQFDLERSAYGTAVDECRQALAVRRRVLGEDHPDTLTSMNNLAETLRSQGDLGAARRLQEQALAVRRRVLGEDHPDTLTSMNNLALVLYNQSDLGAARGLQEQVLAMMRRVLGEDHPDTLTSINNLAETLRSQGDLGAAQRLQEQELTVRRRVLGEDHPDTLTSMNNLAETLRSQGDLGAARGLQEQVLTMRRRVLGEDHPDTLTSINNLAATLRSQGDLGSV
jgi:hypothetical protein